MSILNNTIKFVLKAVKVTINWIHYAFQYTIKGEILGKIVQTG